MEGSGPYVVPVIGLFVVGSVTAFELNTSNRLVGVFLAMGSSPVRMENRYVRIAAGESRIARPPRTAFPDSKSDKHKERETTDSPPPTRLSNEGFCLNEVQTFDSKAPHSSIPQTGSRKIVLDHHSSSVIGKENAK